MSPTPAPSSAWLALAGLHGLGVLGLWAGGFGAPSDALDLASPQAWATLGSSPWTHLSAAHAAANLATLGAVAALGGLWRAPALWALAWALAWPLTALALRWWPEAAGLHGLSGVNHAGLAVLVVGLWLDRRPVRVEAVLADAAGRHDALTPWSQVTAARRWAAVLGAGLVLKLLHEQAWAQPVLWSEHWGFHVNQAAHLAGAVAGAAALLGLLALRAWLWRARSCAPAPWSSSP